MRLIDADKLYPDVMKVDGSMAISQGQLAHAKTIEAIPKAEYENRLKADMVAMLEKLISEANELEEPKYILETSELPLDVDGTTLPLETYALQCYCRGGEDVIDIIEKKINKLKEI